jgi:hypothetical protein
MPCKLGDYLGGIRTVEDLRQRCRIDSETDCWHWSLAMVQGAPTVHFVAPDTGARTKMRGRRAALYLSTGQDIPAGHVAFARLKCRSADCVNPAHCTSGDRHHHGAWITAAGVHQWPDAKAKRSAASRKAWDKRGRKITQEQAHLIRTSDEDTHSLAKQLGRSQFAVWSVRAGKTHREHLAQASVFTGLKEAA